MYNIVAVRNGGIMQHQTLTSTNLQKSSGGMKPGKRKPVHLNTLTYTLFFNTVL